MNGGSGISIYGYSTNNKAVLRNNVITGNLWGITAIYFHDIDMGTEDEWGYNEIHDNGNSAKIYDLYNNSSCDIMAVGNNWGTIDENDIEDHIVHQYDDPSYGVVTFIPYIGYDQVEEHTFDYTDLDLSKADIFSITGQRINAQSLRPGVYIVVSGQASQRTVQKVIIK